MGNHVPVMIFKGLLGDVCTGELVINSMARPAHQLMNPYELVTLSAE